MVLCALDLHARVVKRVLYVLYRSFCVILGRHHHVQRSTAVMQTTKRLWTPSKSWEKSFALDGFFQVV